MTSKREPLNDTAGYVASLRRAREIMKDARDGHHDWMDEALAAHNAA